MLVDVRALAEQVAWVGQFIDKHPTTPALSSVNTVAEGEKLTLTATNLETTGIATVASDGAMARWTATVPGALLLRCIEHLAPSTAEISFHAGGLAIEQGGFRATIAEVKTGIFSQVPTTPSRSPQASFYASTLAINRVLASIIPEDQESRFTLSGALLELDGSSGKFVSTDGFRLSVVSIDGTGARPAQALITRKALRGLKWQGKVSFLVDGDLQFFVGPDRTIISRALHGSFPDYKRVTDQTFASTVKVTDSAALLEAITRVSVFCDEREHSMRWEMPDAELTISSAANGNTAREKLHLGDQLAALDSAYNARYVMDFLRGASGEDVELSFTGTPHAVRFSCPGYQYYLMPMRF